MTCDNPECGITSKMYMIVEKGGNATAFVSAFNGNVDNSQVEEKLRRATEKVMNSQTEVDISTVLIDGDTATIMGVKYKRVEEPKKPETLYDIIVRWWGDAETQDKDPIIADLVDDIEKWLPKEQSAAGSQNIDTELLVDGFNHCLTKIKGKLR